MRYSEPGHRCPAQEGDHFAGQLDSGAGANRHGERG